MNSYKLMKITSVHVTNISGTQLCHSYYLKSISVNSKTGKKRNILDIRLPWISTRDHRQHQIRKSF